MVFCLDWSNHQRCFNHQRWDAFHQPCLGQSMARGLLGISWVYNGIQWIIMGYIWDIIRYSGMYNQQYDGSVWKRGMHTVKLECYCQYVERWWSAIKSWGTLFSDKIVSVAYLCVSPYMICTRKLYQLTVKHPIWEDQLVVRGQGELLCWIFRVILGWSSKELGNWAW